MVPVPTTVRGGLTLSRIRVGPPTLVCSKGRGGQMMDAWKKARHDGACNILVRLGKAAGLRDGADMDVEAPTCSPGTGPATSG